MSVKNNTIMESAWLSGSNDFQARVPDPTQHSMAEVSKCLFDPMNNDLYNQWSNMLINRVGMTIFNNKRFENPLAFLRRENMPYGKTIQNIACAWAKAHSYDDASQTLLAYARPEMAQSFVTVDRFDRYEVSITRNEMRQACVTDYGLNLLVDMAIGSVVNAEAYDEMNIMLQLFARHDADHGIFKHHLSAAPTDKATSQEMLSGVKQYVNRLQFPSVLYNAQDVNNIPTFAKQDEMLLFVTPDVMANLDVYAFADLFNVSRAEVNARLVLVPEFPMANVQAILTTRDAFICSLIEYGIYDFWNPETLTTKSYLHAQGAYGINPFSPMIAFTTGAATVPTTDTLTVTGVTITPDSETAFAGATVPFTVELQGSWSDGSLEVRPDAVTWIIEATDGSVELNRATYVDRDNVLHIQKSGIEADDELTLTATATYINPSGATQAFTDTATITIA